MAFFNPYENVNWNEIQPVQSCSHMHITNQTQFDFAYSQGVRHFPITNYHPSVLTYPLTVRFQPESIPSDVVGAPNTEHYGITNETAQLHITSPGSMYESGDGVRDTWQYLIDNAVSNMQFEDAGGVIIVHPVWIGLKSWQIAQFLDYHPYVIGIEAFTDVTNGIQGDSRFLWDSVLATGRKCLGFMNPDHGVERLKPWKGRNHLLAEEFTERELLKCYRDGRTFMSDNGRTDLLSFTNISLNNGVISVSCNNEATITIISDISTNDNIAKQIVGTSTTYEVVGLETYVRIEAEVEGEKVYSQPFMFKSRDDVKQEEFAKQRMVLI